jgi:hypothetical protein
LHALRADMARQRNMPLGQLPIGRVLRFLIDSYRATLNEKATATEGNQST